MPTEVGPALAGASRVSRHAGELRALKHHGLLDGVRLDGLKGTPGHMDVGFDIMLLCSLLQSIWPRIAQRTAVREEELDAAHRLAEKLVAAVGLRDEGEQTKSLAWQERARAFHLLSRAYDQRRRCLLFILGSQPAVNEVAPAFIMGRSRKYAKRRSRAASSDVTPKEER